MFLQKKILTSTKDYSSEINSLKNEIETADAILIGAGAGLSTAAGFTYSGERFEKCFSDFIEKYNFRDMYSGVSIHLNLWKNTGHTGRDTFSSTVTWTLTTVFTRDCLNL